MKMQVLLSLVFCVVLIETLWAYRPLTTEDATVAPGGKGELELGYDYIRQSHDSQSHSFLVVGTFGIANRLEVSAEIPFLIAETTHSGPSPGIGDIRSVAKFLLLPEKGLRPGFALQGFFKFNTGDEFEGRGTGDREAGFFGILTKNIDDFQVHGMMGLDFIASGSRRGERSVIYGIAVDYTVGPLFQRSFHVVTEVFGNYNFDPDISFGPASWLIGVLYELSPAWVLDSGVTIGLGNPSSDFAFTLGSTFSFP